jgi:hypothetical protein
VENHVERLLLIISERLTANGQLITNDTFQTHRHRRMSNEVAVTLSPMLEGAV